MNEKKHTPTPWKAVQDDDSWAIATCKAGWGIEFIAREIEQGHTNGEADAAHIVHCVNTYEEREALLKEMREGLEDAKHQIEYMHKKFQRTGSGNQVLSRIETLLSKHTS